MGRYEFSDDVSVYGRVATGYRAGGFNAPDTTQVGTTNLVPFDPETLTSYELGFKSELFDRRLRLNAAVFHSIYQDFAVNIPVVTSSPGIFGSRIVNAGEVTYTGAEIEGQAILSEVFSIDASIGYVDGETQELFIPTSGAVGAPIVDIASINNVGYTSEWTGNIAINAQFPTGIGDSRIVGRIGYTYESPKYSFANSISAPFNDLLRSDTVNNIDAQLSLTGVSVGGAELEFRLWGRNLTDEHDLARAIDFGALGYAGGIYADPQMYGFTVTARY
jgi:iron complex outermembrane receptor protein